MATSQIQDRRRMFELFNDLKVTRPAAYDPNKRLTAYSQERAIADKDARAVSSLDEAVQLWNSMWKADQIHDQTISDNVAAMQTRCADMLSELRAGIERLLPDGGLVRIEDAKPSKLGAAPDPRCPVRSNRGQTRVPAGGRPGCAAVRSAAQHVCGQTRDRECAVRASRRTSERE
jgi:hypothetical protein